MSGEWVLNIIDYYQFLPVLFIYLNFDVIAFGVIAFGTTAFSMLVLVLLPSTCWHELAIIITGVRRF